MSYLPAGCARPDEAALDAFWHAARTDLPGLHLPDNYQVRWIGLDRETTAQVLELIRVGDKTGTFTLPWIAARTDQPVPRVGDAIILIDFDGTPALLIRLTDILDVLFGEITARHIAVDGTPVRDLAVWKPLHTRYWNSLLAPFAMTVTDDMPVWIEKFELLYPEIS
jgi:uncharacterized protein YhfF